jgi:FixJ family two-component response regulator
MTTSAARVVVVDDDASVRRGLERLLRAAGYAVETFGSVQGFLADGAYDRADCLVLDVRMPQQNGLHLQSILTTAGYTIPIIFITGHGDVRMAVKVMKAGAVDFLAKPFDDDELLDVVRQTIATRQSVRE